MNNNATLNVCVFLREDSPLIRDCGWTTHQQLNASDAHLQHSGQNTETTSFLISVTKTLKDIHLPHRSLCIFRTHTHTHTVKLL